MNEFVQISDSMVVKKDEIVALRDNKDGTSEIFTSTHSFSSPIDYISLLNLIKILDYEPEQEQEPETPMQTYFSESGTFAG